MCCLLLRAPFLRHAATANLLVDNSLIAIFICRVLCQKQRGWRIRRPAAQSKLRELDPRAHAACFVPNDATQFSTTYEETFLSSSRQVRNVVLSIGIYLFFPHQAEL